MRSSAAVEQLHRPELRGRPIIVGGDPNGRSVVSSASYEPRLQRPLGHAHGVGTKLRTRRACSSVRRRPVRRDLPDGVPCGAVHPDVRAASVDEAYLDVTGCERLFGPPLAIAKAVRARIAARLGLSASVGVASGPLRGRSPRSWPSPPAS